MGTNLNRNKRLKIQKEKKRNILTPSIILDGRLSRYPNVGDSWTEQGTWRISLRKSANLLCTRRPLLSQISEKISGGKERKSHDENEREEKHKLSIKNLYKKNHNLHLNLSISFPEHIVAKAIFIENTLTLPVSSLR